MTPQRAPTAANRVSVQTPTGRGAIAVVAIEGVDALATLDRDFLAANGKRLSKQPIGRLCFGRFLDEEVVACRVSPAAAEVHCHGGRYAAQRIVDRLAAAGCRIVRWDDWADSDGAPTIAGESIRALASARTLATAAILLDQYHGALSEAVERAESLLAAGQAAAARASIEVLRSRYAVGRRLTERYRIVIAGRPNVGKSSLINTLLGYRRAIVADLAGTTRDIVAAEAALAGWPVQLIDAAGLRSTADPLEAAGVRLAAEEMARADAVVWVVDATELPTVNAEGAAAAALQERSTWNLPAETPVLTVINKIDCRPGVAWPTTGPVLGVSALKGLGIDLLTDCLAELILPAALPPGTAVPFTVRHDTLLAESLAALDRGDLSGAMATLKRLAGGAATES